MLGLACGTASAMQRTPGVIDPAAVAGLRRRIQVLSVQ